MSNEVWAQGTFVIGLRRLFEKTDLTQNGGGGDYCKGFLLNLHFSDLFE